MAPHTVCRSPVCKGIKHLLASYCHRYNLEVGLLQISAQSADFIVCVAHRLLCLALASIVELIEKSLCVGEALCSLNQRVSPVHTASQVRRDSVQCGHDLRSIRLTGMIFLNVRQRGC